MTVQVVTDTGCDIPDEIIRELNIKTVPFLVQWGKNSLHDGIDIKPEQIYGLLREGVDLKTAAPAPGDFVNVYQESGKEILSIHVSRKVSATYEAALFAKAIIEGRNNCRIEVVDSEAVVMGMGFLVIMAAEMALKGEGLDEIVKAARDTIPKIHMVGVLDTLKYVLSGGRLKLPNAPIFRAIIDKAESSIHRKAAITMKDGKISFVSFVKEKQREGKLIEFAQSFLAVESVAIEYTDLKSEEDARRLYDKIKGLFPGAKIYFSKIGAALGVHAGPGTLAVSILGEKRQRVGAVAAGSFCCYK